MPNYKTEGQIEFADLVNASGCKAVEIAAALKISKPSISKILAGKQNPRPSTLEHLRKFVASRGNFASDADSEQLSEKTAQQTSSTRVLKAAEIPQHERAMKYPSDDTGGSVAYGNSLFEQATNELREIAESDPSKLREVAQIITTYKKTIPKKKKGKS